MNADFNLGLIFESINFFDYLCDDQHEDMEQMYNYVHGLRLCFPNISLKNTLKKYITLWTFTQTNQFYVNYLNNKIIPSLENIFKTSHWKYDCAGRGFTINFIKNDKSINNPFYNESIFELNKNDLYKLLRSHWYLSIITPPKDDDDFSYFDIFNNITNTEVIKNNDYLEAWEQSKFENMFYKEIDVTESFKDHPNAHTGFTRHQSAQFWSQYYGVNADEYIDTVLVKFIMDHEFWIHKTDLAQLHETNDSDEEEEEENINLKDKDAFNKATGVNKQDIEGYVRDLCDKVFMNKCGNTFNGALCKNNILITRGAFSAVTLGDEYHVNEMVDQLSIWWFGKFYNVVLNFMYYGH